VNVATRLEGISEPAGFASQRTLYRQVRDKMDVNFEDAGEQQLKNIARPVRIYRMRPIGEQSQRPKSVASQNLESRPRSPVALDMDRALLIASVPSMKTSR
jgi:hypothetical protein